MNTEVFKFSDEQLLHIRNRWNNNYVERLINSLRDCSNKWKLTNIQLIPFYSQNCIFTCFSQKYGDVVLKIGYRSLVNEYNCLREFNGRNVCKVYEYDEESEAILEQRIIPGTSLLNEKNQEARIEIFTSLFQILHITPTNIDSYMSFSDKLKRRFKYIKTREDCKDFLLVVDKAEKLFETITVKYNNKKLLHGDLHHENILLCKDGKYVIIDANGTVGDPVFEVSRFIMLEFGDNLTGGKEEVIMELVTKLSKCLNIPDEILIQCLFVDNVLWLCSDLESGEALDESQFIINNILVVANLISNTNI
jgi:streptomycin 6-kinase